MTRTSKRVSRKANLRNENSSKRVSTVRQAVKAYGGMPAMADAFQTEVSAVKQWLAWDEILSTEHLGLYVGLRARGIEITEAFRCEAFVRSCQ